MSRIIKIINKKINSDYELTSLLVEDYLKESSFFMPLSKRLEDVQNQIKYIFLHTNIYQRTRLFDFLVNFDCLKNIFIEEINFFADLILESENYNYDLLNSYLNIMKNKIITQEEIKMLLEKISVKYYFDIKHKILDQNSLNLSEEEQKKTKDFLDEYYNKNSGIIMSNTIKSILVRHDFNNVTAIEDYYDKVYNDFFIILFKELMEESAISPTDIMYLDSGATSTVFSIGSKVIKIGKPRYTHIIPNNENIIQPLIRFNLDSKGVIFGCVEIMEKAFINSDLSVEEVYQVYKKLRDAGIIWKDPGPRNLGKLLRENMIHLNGEKLVLNQIINGFKTNNDRVLDEGELVVVDTDIIYHESDLPNGYTTGPDSNIYEALYKEEQNKKEEAKLK